jgi:hypothetical protein
VWGTISSLFGRILSHPDFDAAVMALLQVVALIFQCVIFKRQLDIVRRQTELMERSDQSTRLQQRAYVSFTRLATRGNAWTTDWELVAIWTNHGLTPAYPVHMEIKVTACESETIPAVCAEHLRETDELLRHQMIASKDTLECEGHFIPMDQLVGVAEQRYRLVIDGRLDYRHIFDRHVEFARFRYLLGCDDGAKPVWRALGDAEATIPRQKPRPTRIRI